LLEDYSFAPIGLSTVLFRLGIALAVGAIIGLERETKSKPAGLRTNMLVCFGSALIVLVPIEIGAAQKNIDILGRVISGVISGIGFIGGGSILQEPKVKGLTTAAAIWISAALGITIGCGLWLLGLIGAFVTWIILRPFHKWENRL
jgi:putative Mg2+ transporter-C (MgtC) family protein